MTYTGTMTLAYRANGGTFDVDFEIGPDYPDHDGVQWTARDSENGHELHDDTFYDVYGDWIRSEILQYAEENFV